MGLGEIIDIIPMDDVSRQSISDRPINLDANANTSVTPVVADAVLSAMICAANASSAHSGGEAARAILAGVRDAVSSLAEGVDEDMIVFTSGCTEANNMVLNAVRSQSAALITTSVEHPSIMAPAHALRAEGFDVTILPVADDGLVVLAELEAAIARTHGPVILSIQMANSETGVIQPIAEIAKIVSRHPRILLHCDAAQACGKMPMEVSPGGPHALTISGHKFHAPMGVGALLLARDEQRIGPMILGGEQQDGRRSGTEALPLIAGLGVAARERRLHLENDVRAMRHLRDRLEAAILAGVPEAVVHGASAPRLPNTSSIRFPGQDAMALVAQLDARGVQVSQGSACSSMRPVPSHVLLAMGLSEDDAFSTVRFSTSPLNTAEEIDAAAEIICRCYKRGGIFA